MYTYIYVYVTKKPSMTTVGKKNDVPQVFVIKGKERKRKMSTRNFNSCIKEKKKIMNFPTGNFRLLYSKRRGVRFSFDFSEKRKKKR